MRDEKPAGRVFGVGRALLITVALLASGAAGADINRWTSGGPWTGAIIAIAADPTDPQTVYASSQYDGIFRSRDGGLSWQPINQGLLDAWITGLAIDPSNPSTLYASSYGDFVYRSTDGGDHWVSQFVSDPSSSYGLASGIAIDPLAPSTVYVATGDGIWKTTDGGCSWGPSNGNLPPGPHGVGSVIVSPTDEGVVFAFLTFPGKLYRSSDGGTSWTAVLSLFMDPNVHQIGFDPADPLVAFAASSTFNEVTAESGGAVYRSADGGLTWNPVSTLPNEPFWGASVDRFNGSVFVSGSDGVRVSTDSGATWSTANEGLPSVGWGALAQGAVADLWWASSAGVFQTTDSGSHWSDATTGLSGLHYGRIVIDPTDDSMLWCSSTRGGGKSVFRSTDGGSSWTNSSSGLGNQGVGPLAEMPGPPLTLFAGVDSRTIYRSTDMGDTWAAAGTLDNSATPAVNSLVVPPTNPGRIYAVAGPLFYSDDGGDTWTSASADPHFLDFVAADSEVAGSLIGVVDGTIQRSTDSGATWTASNVGLEAAAVNLTAQDPATPDHMLAGVQGDAVAMTVPVYESLDRGATWTPSSEGLPQKIAVASIAFDTLDPSTVYATAYAFLSPGADVARPIYRSLDGGATWAPYDRGLPSRRPDSAQILATAGGTLQFLGQGGVFELRPSSTPPPSISAITPTSGPAAGGTLVIIGGSGFASLTSVQFGTAQAEFAVVDDSHVAAIVPPGVPGAAPVTVTTEEPQQETVASAFVYDFGDLPPGSPFHDSIVAFALRAVTGGCGGGSFCPGSPLNRGQTAVQIEKALRGADYPFDPVFGGPGNFLSMADVDRCSGFGPYIQQFLFDGITVGCGNLDFCPLSPVTRAQMMVFLLRAEHGSSYLPPPATGTVFTDVPADSFAADFIEAAAAEGITAGCGGGNFCPEATVTRGQAAALINKTLPAGP
jgi:IPT/TIG domain/S-layer homology domain